MDLTNKIKKIDEFFDSLNIEDFEEILVKAGVEVADSHTSVDCIEIVKCKDCIHSKKHVSIIQDDGNIKHYYRLCELKYPDIGFKDDDYCDCGKRRDV